ncbi:DUF1593 domain-containing protein [Prolixibacteraceae bacterium Z1-6]|uniref:DUF1593 domain-containing protein n=1 Tax=Draconibacterium aestuarii TaxID=2998507 RepID=A0A9X3F7N0_9BACT|nr:DUF1593 domain-containing protein [Prolixibacteraceae bacterium Z1-6]
MTPIKKSFFPTILFVLSFVVLSSCGTKSKSHSNTINEENNQAYRVIVSSDIGGTDPDDFQSMIHLFLYADTLDIEGIISSPFGPGKKEHILNVIDQYEKDYPNLKTYSDKYPSADSLRHITKQGAEEVVDYSGIGKPSEGSEWIIECARKNDPRPLYVLVWGGIEDLAQALHDAPDILPKLRVYYIGGPNKKWTPDAYQYVADNHPDLWIIESNATYRGWFTGGDQSTEWSNTGFPEKYISGQGAMADFFMTQLDGTIKMGDTPSLAWLLKGDLEDPSKPGWGGQYVRAWDRPHYLFTEMPSATDSIQEFSILEIALSVENDLPQNPEAKLLVENQALAGTFTEDGTVRFRFSPKSDKIFKFKIESNVAELNGKLGEVTVFIPPPYLAEQASEKYPNWWTDDPNTELMEGKHIGAKTVSKWRKEFLTDFAKRIHRCANTAE